MNARVARIVRMIPLINTFKAAKKEDLRAALARVFNVSEGTIEKDLAVLSYLEEKDLRKVPKSYRSEVRALRNFLSENPSMTKEIKKASEEIVKRTPLTDYEVITRGYEGVEELDLINKRITEYLEKMIEVREEALGSLGPRAVRSAWIEAGKIKHKEIPESVKSTVEELFAMQVGVLTNKRLSEEEKAKKLKEIREEYGVEGVRMPLQAAFLRAQALYQYELARKKTIEAAKKLGLEIKLKKEPRTAKEMEEVLDEAFLASLGYLKEKAPRYFENVYKAIRRWNDSPAKEWRSFPKAFRKQVRAKYVEAKEVAPKKVDKNIFLQIGRNIEAASRIYKEYKETKELPLTFFHKEVPEPKPSFKLRLRKKK